MKMPAFLLNLMPGSELRSITLSLLDGLHSHDAATAAHSIRVAMASSTLIASLTDDAERKSEAVMAGLLHDIGKMFIPRDLLSSSRPLTKQERAVIDTHPALGAEVLESLRFPAALIQTARDHHERWDGTGYPSGRKGPTVLPLARAVGVADAFVAMVEPGRAYRAPRTLTSALEEIELCKGSQFDPCFAERLLRTLPATSPEARFCAGELNFLMATPEELSEASSGASQGKIILPHLAR